MSNIYAPVLYRNLTAAMDVCTASSDNELSNDCDIQAKHKNNAVNYLTVNERANLNGLVPSKNLKH
jgi:hypothetical protein